MTTTQQPPAVAVPGTAHPPTRRRRPGITPYALVAGAVAAVLLAMGYPLARQLVMAFQEFGLAQQFGRPAEWVGLDNFAGILTDPFTWTVMARSVAFCLVTAAVTMVIGVFLATVMTRISTWARLVLQVVLLLVWSIPVISSLTVWQLLFETRFGVVNWTLDSLGLDWARDFNWLGRPLGMLTIASVIVIWMSVPLVAFMAYSGLSQVPEEVTEAAQLDGANAWQRFRLVTVPIIAPVLLLIGLLQIIWDLRVFTQIYVLQQAGAPLAATDLIGTYVYRLGIGQGNYGVASAMATVVLLLTLLLTAPYVRSLFASDREAAA